MNKLASLFLAILFLVGCGADDQSKVSESPDAGSDHSKEATDLTSAAVKGSFSSGKNALFGDLHVHTTYSFDAFIFGTRATPDDAYRFAKGGSLQHPAGFEMKLDQPLDFYAVTDHAVFLNHIRSMTDPSASVYTHPSAEIVRKAVSIEERMNAFQSLIAYFSDPKKADEMLDINIVKSAWKDITEAAERHNDPGTFTTFLAYEYTSGPQSQNLHRNVIFSGSKVPDTPFSRLDSPNPEDLWDWMDNLRESGIEALSIPHNSNGSNGQMFSLVDFSGNPFDVNYADQRMRNEPLVEISQVKGTSDTHPLLSPNDEWADFEIMPYMIATSINSNINGSYIREAYLNGLKIAAEQGFDPFHFGVIGSSDTHNASYAGDESDYWSKVGLLDADGKRRGSVPIDGSTDGKGKYANTYYNTWSAAGLAGVWAEENTRDSIYAAFRRKETFGTSGPRIRVRFFAGYDLPNPATSGFIEQAYQSGVPMGADLLAQDTAAPEFFVWATQDALSAPLQRLQVIKGWMEAGEIKEQVFDVACSGSLELDPASHRCPENGASVNLNDCSITADKGAPELKTIWQDPEFNPSQRAFYYVRVLENPTCRWSTWDAIRAGVAPREDLHKTIQERAWSSPIWYIPASQAANTP